MIDARLSAMTGSVSTESQASSFCAATLIGCVVGVMMLSTSILGIAGTFNVSTLLVLLLAALLAGLAIGSRSRAVPWPRSNWLVLVALLLVIPTAVAFLPVHTWDEYAYSVSLPRDYAGAGYIFYQSDYGPYSAFPGNYEALTTTSLFLVNSVIPVKLLNIILIVGMAIIAIRISRYLGTPDRFAIVAAFLLMASPSLGLAVTVAKNDVANAFFQALSVLAFVRYIRTQRVVDLSLSAAFLGIALGIKYNSLQFALCFFASAALVVLRMPHSQKTRLRDLSIALIVFALVASPWYIRNLMEFGNPFFPFYNDIFGGSNGFTPLHSNITQEMFWGLSGYSWASGDGHDFLSKYSDGFGLITSIFAILGLLISLRKIHNNQVVFLATLFVIYSLFILRFGFWEPRYSFVLLVFVSAFAAVAFARGLVFLERTVQVRLITPWVLGGILFLTSGWGLYRQYDTHKHSLNVAASASDAPEFCSKTVAYWDLVEWVNGHLGQGDKIAIGVNIQPFFYIEKPYFHIHPMTEKGNLQALETVDQYLDTLKSLGITMLAYAPADLSQFYPVHKAPLMYDFLSRLDSIVQELAERGDLELLHQMGRISIYRLRTDS